MSDITDQSTLAAEPDLLASAQPLPDEFDEDAYLLAFPDIEHAIAAGDYSSAAHHYTKFGQAEDRLALDSYKQALRRVRPDGEIDFYGHNSLAGAWILRGWLSGAGSEETSIDIVATFEHGQIDGETIVLFDHRNPPTDSRQRFVALVRAADDNIGNLVLVELNSDALALTLHANAKTKKRSGQDIAASIRSIALDDEEPHRFHELLLLMSTSGYGGLVPWLNTTRGFVDSYGYHAASAGWYLCGWITRSWDSGRGPDELILHFSGDDLVCDTSASVAGFFPREDVEGLGVGFILFAQASECRSGSLVSIEIQVNGAASFLLPSQTTQRWRDIDVANRFKPIAEQVADRAVGRTLLSLITRRGYNGESTLASLSDTVLMDFDEIIACPPGGLLAMGWLLVKPGTLRSIRLRSGDPNFAEPMDFNEFVRVNRPDVISAVGAEHGIDDVRCGFIAYLPKPINFDSSLYIEVETVQREVGYQRLPKPKLDGLAAIKRILDAFEVRFTEVPLAFDRTIGPAVKLLNQSRFSTKPRSDEIDFGRPTESPEVSIIIPIYGRLDFIEHQMAYFCEDPAAPNYEIIFVLDDPPKRREALRLFNSVHSRFGVPFRVLLMEQNVGFGPANNAALAVASGDYVCFLNSDVFPETRDWLEKLALRLKTHPDLGAVGPLLLYGDGSVQHEGMSFEPLQEFGGWYFGLHPRKGFKRSSATGLRKHISITGACILMRRDLAQQLGGFDECYIIGDFEDSDLCLRLQSRGLDCAVDLDVEMYHLERKSQMSSARAWRMNLTLYNAWVHERRWAATIKTHSLRSAAGSSPDEDLKA